MKMYKRGSSFWKITFEDGYADDVKMVREESITNYGEGTWKVVLHVSDMHYDIIKRLRAKCNVTQLTQKYPYYVLSANPIMGTTGGYFNAIYCSPTLQEIQTGCRFDDVDCMILTLTGEIEEIEITEITKE